MFLSSPRALVSASQAAALFLASAWLLPEQAGAAEYYVATTGNDSSAGSMAQPFATLQKAIGVVAAGDTIWIRGGQYRITKPATSAAGININKSGTSDSNRIRIWAYPGEVPVFDFSQLAISDTDYTTGVVVSGSWLHIKGLEIANVPMKTKSNSGVGVNEPAHDNIFEQLNIHHISGTGLFISHGTGGHLILNSDSHDNYDPTSTQGDGQNADGFGAHYQESGKVTTFRGCRAWWNSDDGWDFISQEYPVIVENSWAYGNGYINSGTGKPADGNGNGFKAGSSKTGIRHIVRNNVAWGNRAAGFYANHSSGGNDWFNNTAYKNGTAYNMLASTWDAAGNRTDEVTLTGVRAHKLRNNVGFPNKNSYVDGYGVDSAFNTWDLGITPADSDFAGVSDAGFMGPRQADGSLPALNFMKLSASSKLIDKGTNVSLPFVGTAPDLGAYEFGAVNVGSGGSSGSAGAGAGGAVSTAGSASVGEGGAPSVGGSGTGGNAAGASALGGVNGAGAAAGSSATSSGGPSGPSGGSASTASAGSASSTDDSPSTEAGCACSAVGRASSSAVSSLGLVVMLLSLRRKRRSRATLDKI